MEKRGEGREMGGRGKRRCEKGKIGEGMEGEVTKWE